MGGDAGGAQAGGGGGEVTAVDVHTVLLLADSISENSQTKGMALLTTALLVAAVRAGLTNEDLIATMRESYEVNAGLIAQLAAEPSV